MEIELGPETYTATTVADVSDAPITWEVVAFASLEHVEDDRRVVAVNLEMWGPSGQPQTHLIPVRFRMSASEATVLSGALSKAAQGVREWPEGAEEHEIERLS